ncbi:MAG: TROVE domain-containing protein [Chitinophagaceae bacterium]|nr:TROVE domain-containing protein [Anaerolineae bacterium]
MRQTPQIEPIPGTNQFRNSAGGFVWQVDEWQRLHRFLVLGSEGGSYYAAEQALTVANANNVIQCIQKNGLRVVQEVVAISHEGRAPKNDPAIFALALATTYGDPETRTAALDALSKVCRTGTHLFTFAEYVKAMRGWGRGLRRGVSGWYHRLEGRDLAYQLVKYRQRNGWTHTDMLRLAHVMPQTDTQGAIFKWVTRHDDATWARELVAPENDALALIWAFEQIQGASTLDQVLKLIAAYDLPREALPTQWLNEPAVWEALLAKMPMTAMIRNLATMSRVGLLMPMSEAEKTVVGRLTDANLLRKARVHPISVLSALRVYAQGYSLRGQAYERKVSIPKEQEWTPTPRITDALDTAFELAFKHIEPSNKRVMLALDVSGSMSIGMIAGVPGLTPREASAAMAMVTARTEPYYNVISFQNTIMPLNISAKMRLDDVLKVTSGLPFGATDCAQPMIYALEHKIAVDTFVIYTDSETWFGAIHPAQALRNYREKMGIATRLVVVGMVANPFSIADPNDAGMMDVVGFDSAAPGLIADFARGEL